MLAEVPVHVGFMLVGHGMLAEVEYDGGIARRDRGRWRGKLIDGSPGASPRCHGVNDMKR
jgi:hypothetical protein